MRILLIDPPFKRLTGLVNNFFPIGLGYLANESYEALDSTTYTLVTPCLPPGTVEEYCNKAFRSFYYSPGYILRRLRHIRDVGDVVRYVKSAFYAFKAVPSIFGTTWQKNKYRM